MACCSCSKQGDRLRLHEARVRLCTGQVLALLFCCNTLSLASSSLLRPRVKRLLSSCFWLAGLAVPLFQSVHSVRAPAVLARSN
jgi:hypothetical protein